MIPATDVLSVQFDLFERPGLVGLTQAEEIITPAEERALIACIDQAGQSPFRFQGWLGKRLTASYGWRYDFDTGIFGPTDPIPDWLLPLHQKAAEFAGLTPDELVQVLVIRYDPGAGIGWHRDKAVFGHIIGISLGAPTTLRFRRRKPGGFDRASVFLAPRSAYHLTGPARNEWEHSIAEMVETRWSVTFRSLAQKVRQN
ncbi:MAG: alpha-ketoglutarate-dependent dioxygenase AlkB [Acetobacteraceae bacterium]|nr:alpha-ketoglutarate-dependent dioxygenase AlkB [Acetobacteraceae bacterium]